LTYILPLTVWVYLHSNFYCGLRKTIFFPKSAFRLFKVIDFGTNRKRVSDFLLVRHCNLGPILHRFRDIAGFCAHDSTPPLFEGYFTLILGCSHCTRSPMLGSARAEA